MRGGGPSGRNLLHRAWEGLGCVRWSESRGTGAAGGRVSGGAWAGRGVGAKQGLRMAWRVPGHRICMQQLQRVCVCRAADFASCKGFTRAHAAAADMGFATWALEKALQCRAAAACGGALERTQAAACGGQEPSSGCTPSVCAWLAGCGRYIGDRYASLVCLSGREWLVRHGCGRCQCQLSNGAGVGGMLLRGKGMWWELPYPQQRVTGGGHGAGHEHGVERRVSRS